MAREARSQNLRPAQRRVDREESVRRTIKPTRHDRSRRGRATSALDSLNRRYAADQGTKCQADLLGVRSAIDADNCCAYVISGLRPNVRLCCVRAGFANLVIENDHPPGLLLLVVLLASMKTTTPRRNGASDFISSGRSQVGIVSRLGGGCDTQALPGLGRSIVCSRRPWLRTV